MASFDIYQNRCSQFTTEFTSASKQFNRISILRLCVALLWIFSVIKLIQTQSVLWLLFTALLVIIFIVFIKIHDRFGFQKIFTETLADINKKEANFLKKRIFSYPNGSEYIDPNHMYSYDLDIFGDKSLFQMMNRSATYIGKNHLAQSLLVLLDQQGIEQTQAAVKELAGDLDWRQEIHGLSVIASDNKEVYNNLIAWSNQEANSFHILTNILSYAVPSAFVIALFFYFNTDIPLLSNLIVILFIGNLMILGSHIKVIKKEIVGASKIASTIKSYSQILQKIENKSFQSIKLKHLQKDIIENTTSASKQLGTLSKLFSQLDNLLNPVGAIFFNGIFLYHLHTLRTLLKWKRQFAHSIPKWLEVIGKIEMLSSMGNFAFNNDQFVFPSINQNHCIEFNNLGHPLIDKEERIANDISFQDHSYIILTGSNMSGKSTFLRSLGVNMVLAGAGAPICASFASIHPLPILVSMRLSDNLSQNESYFYAEVKRLKAIMDVAEEIPCFVLLDEILRGTNSEDKRSGTIEVIKKIVGLSAFGAIATHDLKVCDISTKYPDDIINKCFEVEIVDDELSFDYKLRDGICQNKNATFLMKKMEVI